MATTKKAKTASAKNAVKDLGAKKPVKGGGVIIHDRKGGGV